MTEQYVDRSATLSDADDALADAGQHSDRSVPRHRRARRRRPPGPAEPAVERLPVLPRRAWRLRIPTTCTGSPIDGRRCRATGARSCCTRRSTTPASRRSASTVLARVIELWDRAIPSPRRSRRRRLRADVREPRSRGRCNDRSPARADLRLRPRSRAAATPARGRLGARRRSRRPLGGRARRLASLGAGRLDVSGRARSGADRTPARHHRARAIASATRWPSCWSTCWAGWTGCRASRCPT